MSTVSDIYQKQADDLLAKYGDGPVCFDAWVTSICRSGGGGRPFAPGPHEVAACHYAGFHNCLMMYDDTGDANDYAPALFPNRRDDNKLQAFHHAYWVALMVIQGIPLDEIRALVIAHEVEHGGLNTQDSRIDMRNNSAGLQIGQYMLDHHLDNQYVVVHLHEVIYAALSRGGRGTVYGVPLDLEKR